MIVIEVEVSWSTVYYTLDLSAIWIWHLQNTKMSKSTWNHLSHADRWSWLRPKYLGQWYTIVQTFWPFGYDIFKIPKCQNQLYFWFKIARVAMLGIMYHMVVHDSKRSAQVWSIFEVSRGFWPLRPKYLGQRYTILQTFRPFGNDIFKIPKCQNQLWFWFKLAPRETHWSPKKKHFFLDSKTGKTQIAPKINSKQLLWRLFYSQKIPFAYKSRFGGFPENLLRGCS